MYKETENDKGVTFVATPEEMDTLINGGVNLQPHVRGSVFNRREGIRANERISFMKPSVGNDGGALLFVMAARELGIEVID